MQGLNDIEMLDVSGTNHNTASKDNQNKIIKEPKNFNMDIDDEEILDNKEVFYFDNEEDINKFLDSIENNLKDDNSLDMKEYEENELIKNNISGLLKKTTGDNRRITIKEKLLILEEAKAFGRNKTALKYNIVESTLT